MKRYWPIWTPYAVASLFFIVPAAVRITSDDGIGQPRAILWMIRGCLIGPFEGVINPYLSQQNGYLATGLTIQIFAIATPCLVAMIYGVRRQGILANTIACIGTAIWVLSGLGAALAWI